MRVLVVDDSPLMRRYISRILEESGDFEVETAPGGDEALERLSQTRPDVVTLDVEMPGSNGLATLARIMDQRPCPVVMVSAYTDRGANATLEALALGAVDYVTKPAGTVSLHVEEWGPVLLEKVRSAANARVHSPVGRRPSPSRPAASLQGSSEPGGIVVVGASTGGPRTLDAILPALPADFPWPIVLAQHMPPRFTRLFAERMDRLCALEVVEVASPMALAPRIHVAQGDRDMRVSRRAGQVVAMPVPVDARHPSHPSTDVLMESVLELYPPSRVIGVLLTGMGRDGAVTMTRLRQEGGQTIAESEETAVVFGMPGELIAQGGATVVLRANRIASRLLEWVAPRRGGQEAAPWH